MSKKISFSASNISKLLGLNPFSKSKNINKFSPMRHGIFYENEGLDMYELFTKNKVERNFSIKKHEIYTFITGKIDGKTFINGNDIIVEMKYLMRYSKVLSKHYNIQLQIYMELYNINKAHYCEYVRPSECFLENANFKFKYITVHRDKEWFNSILPILIDLNKNSLKKNIF